MSLHMMVQRNVRRAIGTRFFPKIGTKVYGAYIETVSLAKLRQLHTSFCCDDDVDQVFTSH